METANKAHGEKFVLLLKYSLINKMCYSLVKLEFGIIVMPLILSHEILIHYYYTIRSFAMFFRFTLIYDSWLYFLFDCIFFFFKTSPFATLTIISRQ